MMETIERETEAHAFPTGVDILHDPVLNKGTAFTADERDRLHLRGLLPPRATTQDEQVHRVLENLRRKPNDLEKYIFMIALQDRNETLFYRVLTDYLDELMPIVYTPTVGQACQEYGHIFRRPRGLYISADDRDRIDDLLANWPVDDVRVIVVTDGERILGLGDLGANGMGIPVGKLSLYTGCAGVLPSWCLPITLDVGTENEALLDDPLYIGLRQRRLREEPFFDFVEAFVAAARRRFPTVLIQFEDFGNANAFRLLERFRDRICCFNDDIQGTASVTLAGLYSALRITGGTLADQRILFLGAGEAAIGTARLVTAALVADHQMTEDEARTRCWLFDSRGLVVTGRTDLPDRKRQLAHGYPPITDLHDAVEALRPTAIIGASGQPGLITQQVVEAMTQLNERPIVFSLSNPTSRTECTAEQAYQWSHGRAVFASGSPFPPVEYQGQRFVPGQGNNAYIFPGVGLGVVLSGSRRVTDEMFFSAAKTLAHIVSEDDLAVGRIYPPLQKIRDVSAAIAAAVMRAAYDAGLATVPEPDDLDTFIRASMYQAEYPDYTPKLTHNGSPER